jgi:hypothetical protein
VGCRLVVTEYAFDLYPRDDPRDGTRLIRYTYEDLIAAEYKDVIGVGSGQATIWHDHSGAEEIDSRGEQYVRIVRLGGAEAVVGGMWTSKLPFETAVASERRHLTFSGPGQMAYLARAVMAPHTYIHDVFTGQDPFDDRWRLSNQSTVFANGPFLGAMLWRVIYEAQHFRNTATYTHKHADGIIYTDSHADDRLVSRIPDIVLGFDQFEDSNGNDWTLTAGEFGAQVGENVLAVVQRLMQAGLSIRMDPDDFTLYAWEGRPATKLGRSTNRTGASWGASVVRFQVPTDATTATGNILSDANRVVNAYLPRGPIWVGGNDLYHKETGTADALYEGFVHSTAEDDDALAQIGAAQRGAREEAADVGTLKTILGDDATNGAYLPGEHYLLDELVRINTGSGEFDYDEANYPVGAWRISLPAGGAEWEAFVDLGASFDEAERREFAIPPTPSHTHPSNLCRPSSPGEVETGRIYFTNNDATGTGLDLSTDYSPSWDVSAITGADPKALYSTPQSTLGNSGTGNPYAAVNVAAGYIGTDMWARQLSDLPAGVLATVQAGGSFSMAVRSKNRTGVGISSDQQNFPETTARIWRPGTSTFIGTLFDVGDATGGYVFAESNFVVIPITATVTAVPSAVGTDILVLELGGDHQTPTSGGTGWAYRPGDSSIDDLPLVVDSAADQNAWAEFSSIGTAGGGEGDGNIRLVGTSNRAKRCDDTEHWHDTREPTVLDDWDQGMRVGTLWLDDTTGRVWWLTDNTAGAAVWVLITDPTPSGGGGSTTLTVTEEDAAPEVIVDTIKFPNGSVTDNGDGSASIAFEETPHSHDPPTAGVHKILVQRTTSFGTSNSNDSVPDYDTVIEDTMTDSWWDAGDPDGLVVTADYDGLDAIITAKGFMGDPGSSDYLELKVYYFPAASGRNRPIDASTDEQYLLGVSQQPADDNINHIIEFVSDPVTVGTGDRIFAAWRTSNNQTLITYEGRTSITLGAYILGGGGGEVTEEDVRDAGRWEVIVSGTAPPVAVSNPDDDDWLYGWVSG